MIPRVRVGYEMVVRQRGAELAIIISYLTSASGIIVFLKTAHKLSRILAAKTTYFHLGFNFEQTRTVTIFGERGITAHILGWLSQLELQNCIIQ